MSGRNIEQEQRVTVRASASNLEMSVDRDFIRHKIHSQMRQSLADFIVNAKMKEDQRDYHTDFTLDLFVFTPDEFWKLVTEEAQRLDSRMRLSEMWKTNK